ncbi:molybdopterin-dependent oxidoreductase [Actinocrispum sp. NPDC049592]|uniref:molybdopterin-dependent oxidoreductase n=1 Tax=Actinocrispum sp. NPDC049592 TaxID=3154835 RepID=UPI003434CE98
MKLPTFKSAAHHERATARIGLWLGIAFVVCFITGLLSHAVQHPPSWFFWPSRPVNLYRITQGVHVVSGIAAIPLLLAKLWSVYPKLFERPLVRNLPHALERGSILVLSGAAFFELTTGILNVAQNYKFTFFFPDTHYAVAWIAVGSIILHIAVKLPTIRRALTRDPEPEIPSRRAFLRTTWIATGVAVLATAGTTLPLLRGVSTLAWRTTNGRQGLPVNRTAAAAGITRDPDWTLQVAAKTFTLDQLNAMPQTTADLPIACVEGWSQNATWTGVPVKDLLTAAGVQPGAEIRVQSMERNGLYRSTVLPGEHTSDPLTLLALKLNGEVLDLDHGYPARIIAPSRPGVLQTKWVNRLEVL